MDGPLPPTALWSVSAARRRSGEELLLLSLLGQAIQDVQLQSTQREAREWQAAAVEWLLSEGAAAVCAALEVEYARLRRWVEAVSHDPGVAARPKLMRRADRG